ncbi:NAD+ synthetase [Caldicellulosiruptor saccharolyticus DSM 8903]|uniref:Glutamine-dependent NAD(+) synthetase n=1 Tax=Caldicellulosiruptor saccharolyticus (strain ATCC 43494 / DSM 8903 / Tp8T 6331) TaxID=351627 RepID=A4XFU0_CALS8|nr:NAD+ synthase [Caldicellulosiruptor saccharolyticus]ABP65775.1 NAD+ synthetase [Caldicellulosiruptor saccharolyticus DSM 8903]
MKVLLCQINPIVGDIEGNTKKIIRIIKSHRDAKILIFPELAICGYPPKDLLFQKDFIEAAYKAIEEIAKEVEDSFVVVGSPTKSHHVSKLFNSAIILHQGKIEKIIHKTLLPSYDVFDENRYFIPSPAREVVTIEGINFGISICEDIWNINNDENAMYDINVLDELSQKGAKVFINLSASPYHYTKLETQRLKVLKEAATKYGTAVIYVNQVGGNDELIFDGNSVVVSSDGRLVAKAKEFEEDILEIKLEKIDKMPEVEIHEDISWIKKALVLGIRDYFEKTGITKKAVVGLSGGIDSSVVCCLAVEALGPENVLGVAMPSRYSSEHSIKDAKSLAENLGIEFRIYPIEDVFKAYLRMFNTSEMPLQDLAEENIQARIRGNILMFISNRENRLVLTTGNKSELAVGYCTLYGDMAGGLAVISDLPKMLVYELARYINREREIIPHNVLVKPPSAELRPNQKDTDSLPPYEILDPILVAYIEELKSVDEIVQMGYPKDLVLKIIKMVERAEYKRKQAAPGLKVTSKAFGFGRRMPIVQRWV